jgi:RNA-directed DNA polymerase
MDVASLLATLRPLLAQPEANLGAICAILQRGSGDVEHEVLRCLAARHLKPLVAQRLQSPLFRERRQAVLLVGQVFGRAEASAILRRTLNDVHAAVRRASAMVARQLAVFDVGLPFAGQDRHPGALRRPGAETWSFLGWFFGSVWGKQRSQTRGIDVSKRSARVGVVFPVGADELAAALGLSSVGALAPLMRAGAGPGAAYARFSIPKRAGGERTICAPRAPLKRVQRVILAVWLSRLPAHPACHGFVAGRSTVSNAAPHVGARTLLKTDIEAFFPTIHYHRVEGLFRLYGANPRVAALLAGLTTCRPVLDDGVVSWPGLLPQGAPTSPAIANLVCGRLDARMAGLARSAGAAYTRYADDLTFSFPPGEPRDVGRFFWWANAILQQEGFNENVQKRRVLRSTQRQQVTGVVVNEAVHLPREDRRRFRATLSNCERHGLASQARGRPDLPGYLLGYAAYAHMVQPELGRGWLARVRALLDKSVSVR